MPQRTASKFSILAFVDKHSSINNSGGNELSRYFLEKLCAMNIDEEAFTKDHFATFRFWVSHKSKFPTLFEVCIRMYSIPVSSCSSERVFSAVERIVSNDRSRLDSDILHNIVLVRSAKSSIS